MHIHMKRYYQKRPPKAGDEPEAAGASLLRPAIMNGITTSVPALWHEINRSCDVASFPAVSGPVLHRLVQPDPFAIGTGNRTGGHLSIKTELSNMKNGLLQELSQQCARLLHVWASSFITCRGLDSLIIHPAVVVRSFPLRLNPNCHSICGRCA